MSNKISRRTFLKVTGASAAALGAAAVLGGCQAGDNSSIEVKVGDKISNWNNLAVQLTSVFTLASAPDAEGYEYIAMLITSANRSSRDTFAIGAQNRRGLSSGYPGADRCQHCRLLPRSVRFHHRLLLHLRRSGNRGRRLCPAVRQHHRELYHGLCHSPAGCRLH